MAYGAAQPHGAAGGRRATPDPTADGPALPCPAGPRMLAQQILASGKDPGPVSIKSNPWAVTVWGGAGRDGAIWPRGPGNVLQEPGNVVLV